MNTQAELDVASERKIYDPCQVDVVQQQLSVQDILDRVVNGRLDITSIHNGTLPWNKGEQSAFIESILIRLPLPVFYFDARDDDKWRIFDGFKRITALSNFVLQKEFSLCGLRYLPQYEGMLFGDLPEPIQRRINECYVYCSLIRAGTSDDIAADIFKRLQT